MTNHTGMDGAAMFGDTREPERTTEQIIDAKLLQIRMASLGRVVDLHEKALRTILDIAPDNIEARARLRGLIISGADAGEVLAAFGKDVK